MEKYKVTITNENGEAVLEENCEGYAMILFAREKELPNDEAIHCEASVHVHNVNALETAIVMHLNKGGVFGSTIKCMNTRAFKKMTREAERRMKN